jgi:hypothetical protein
LARNYSFEAQGAAAADLALEILAGKDPATLPHRTRPPHRHMVDANALKRWDMSEAALPPGCKATIAAALALKAKQQSDSVHPFSMSAVETDREIARLMGSPQSTGR